MKSQVTTHILDTTSGKPASGVTVLFEMRQGDSVWKELARGVTNKDGRLMDLLPEETLLGDGVYRFVFNTGEYFRQMDAGTFYPRVSVEFLLEAGEHYHVPLLLSPYGYSTYLGS